MNAVKKINSLLSSGTVSVTGPTQTRIVKQQPQPQQKTVFVQKGECYVCDEHIGNNGTLVTEAFTTASNTKIPTKIGRIVGDAFMVIVSVDDVICKRCLNMFNQMDRLETDLDRVKTSILTLINKKYGINDNGNAGGNASAADVKPPPVKVQRLNTSAGSMNSSFSNRKTSNGGGAEDVDGGKLTAVSMVQTIPSQQINQFAGQTRLVAVSDGDIAMYDPTQPNNFGQTQMVRQVNATAIQQVQPAQVQQKKPIKIYKCMSCEFKTTDIKLFQPHYETCRQQNGFRCKICKKLFQNVAALKAHNAEKHTSEYMCVACNMNCVNEATFKKHLETHHPEVKAIEPATIVTGTLYACSQCSFKSYDKAVLEAHSRKHVKAKPFKCRICSARFEKREQANAHAKIHCPDYFKCGTCSMTFPQKEQLLKHFETHKPQQQQQHVVQKQQIVAHPQIQQHAQAQIVTQDLSTQKLLQETIDEALRDTGDAGGPKINFYSCHICSLTFVQENYYKHHMETHKSNKKAGTATATSAASNANSLIRTDQRGINTQATIVQAQQNTNISDSDLEIMFEKMHSDKAEIESNTNNSENLVITSQESSTGYTFNITVAGQEGSANNVDLEHKLKGENDVLGHGIDMPRLDQTEEQLQAQQQQHDEQQHESAADQSATDDSEQLQQEQQDGDGHSVNMPSLDDESQPSSGDQVPMDLDDIQNAAESGQIKFILNENGQLLHLENHHILTTDADGNQILVQDSEQIQQLLQSVGVLQTGDGEGGEQTFQMIQGENNQMILVQGENNEAQLIDASMLNEDGQLVIQHHDGELSQGVHIVNEEELKQHTEGLVNEEMQHVAHHEQEVQHQHNEHLEDEQTVLIKTEQGAEHLQQVVNESDITTVTTSTRTPVTSTTGGDVYLCLNEMIGESEQK